MSEAAVIATASPPALSAGERPAATALVLSVALHAGLAAAALWWPHSSNDAALATATVEVAFWPEAAVAEPVTAAALVPPPPMADVAAAEPPPATPEPPQPIVEPEPAPLATETLPALEPPPPPPPPRPRERARATPRPKPVEEPPKVAAAPASEPTTVPPDAAASAPVSVAPPSAPVSTPASTQLAALPSTTDLPSSPPLITQARFRSPPAPPAYPRRAIDLGQEGEVLIRALVGPDGESREIRIFRSSGVPLLDDAALRAVRRWAFEAAQINGRPIEAWVEVPVRFHLRTVL